MISLLECRKIYDEAFCDEREFTDRLFDRCGDYCKTLEKYGNTVSMLFLMPCTLVMHGKKQNVNYIYAAATDRKYRGRGYMTELLNNIKKSENGLLFLKPANDDLIKFYSHCGFKTFNAARYENDEKYIMPHGGFAEISADCRYENGTYTAMLYGGNRDIDLNGVSFPFTME